MVIASAIGRLRIVDESTTLVRPRRRVSSSLVDGWSERFDETGVEIGERSRRGVGAAEDTADEDEDDAAGAAVTDDEDNATEDDAGTAAGNDCSGSLVVEGSDLVSLLVESILSSRSVRSSKSSNWASRSSSVETTDSITGVPGEDDRRDFEADFVLLLTDGVVDEVAADGFDVEATIV